MYFLDRTQAFVVCTGDIVKLPAGAEDAQIWIPCTVGHTVACAGSV